MQKKSKIFALIGMVAGIAALALGIVILAGEFYHYADYIYSPSSRYDYGYAQFGSDYYSYSNNNAAWAAEAAASAAGAADGIQEELRAFGGAMTSFFGVFMICFFGLQLFSNDTSPAPNKQTADAPIGQKLTTPHQNTLPPNTNEIKQAPAPSKAINANDELIKLKKLLDEGIISQEIYDIKKAKYLDML